MDTGGKIEPDYLVGEPINDRSIYQEVVFDVEMPVSFESGADETMRTVLDHALSQLNDIARTRLRGSMPEGVAPMFTYSCREAVEERHQRYLLKTVYAGNGSRTRKASIVEENDAAQQVADELAINRHPVSQFIEQLREKHGSHIGQVALSDIVVSIIKHTAYSRFRNALNNQVDNWSPPVLDIVPSSTGSGMKGRLKPGLKFMSRDKMTDKQPKNSGKPSPKRRIAAIKPRIKRSANNTKTRSSDGKIKFDSRSVELKQKLPRSGHQRTPR